MTPEMITTGLTAISTVGFPIVACIYMAHINQKQTESHKEEMSKITEAINDLKLAITTLVDKLTM